jgi:glycosyltransferase involved in cell wall biosynthesis
LRWNPEKLLVSVILPTYNRAEFLARAIRSVIAQTYPNWELLVVDDTSTDHRRQIVYRFTDPRVYYVRLPVNCGHPARPRNVGWLLARGTYIAYIDDDNAWRPAHLERLVAAAEAHPDAAGTYGGRCHHAPDGMIEEILDPDHGIDTGDALHRRDLVQAMPEMWSETHFTHEDVEFWSRLRQRHPVGLIWVPEILSDYYIHEGNRYYSHWLNLRRYDSGYFSRNAARVDEPARWRPYVDLVIRLGARRVLDVGSARLAGSSTAASGLRCLGCRSCPGPLRVDRHP